MDLLKERSRLREQARAYRRSLAMEEHSALSKAVCERLLSASCFRESEALLCYAPIGREINVLPVLEAGLACSKRVYLPKTLPGGGMAFLRITDFSGLEKSAFGVPEPTGGAAYDSGDNASALCILPGLCFDREGNRLGYGKGFYDRFLMGFHGICAAVAYDACVYDSVFPMEHDRPVHLIFTPTCTINLTERPG